MVLRVIEAFSGIGSQAKALSNMQVDYEIVNTIEWDINAIYAYDIIHNGPQDLSCFDNYSKEELVKLLSQYQVSGNGKVPLSLDGMRRLNIETLKRVLFAIRRTNNLVSITDVTEEDIEDDIDLLTYSFPCQDLSISGFWHGNKSGIDRGANNRSGMLWEVERILEDMKIANRKLPRFLVMENVTNILSLRHRDNFQEWMDFLTRTGYENKVYNLKATNFGIPQNRTRTFMLSVFVGEDEELRKEIVKYFDNNDLSKVKIDYANLPKLDQYLKTDYTNTFYKQEALSNIPNNTMSRKKIFNENPHIMDSQGVQLVPIVRTITTKQDRHPNSGLILHDFNIDGKSSFRYLTPRECFMLMGFDEQDYQNLINENFKTRKNTNYLTNEKLTKFAGNSIVVNVIQAVFEQMIEIKDIFNL